MMLSNDAGVLEGYFLRGTPSRKWVVASGTKKGYKPIFVQLWAPIHTCFKHQRLKMQALGDTPEDDEKALRILSQNKLLDDLWRSRGMFDYDIRQENEFPWQRE